MEEKAKILVVDDEKPIRDVLEDILTLQGYEVAQAKNGMEALDMMKKNAPDVMLLDINMPGLDGLEVTRRVKKDKSLQHIPLVIVSGLDDMQARIEALKLGANDYLLKPFHVEELKARVRSLVKVKAYNDHMSTYQKKLESDVRERTRDLKMALEKLKKSSLDTIYRLSRATEYKDEDTASHIERISHYVQALAEEMGLDEDQVESFRYASPMHDIGKIGIPDRVLLKPGKLTAEEWKIMQQHTIFGAKILEGSAIGFMTVAYRLAASHHEKWDGSGYPK